MPTITGIPGEKKTLKLDTSDFTEGAVTIDAEEIAVTVWECLPAPSKAELPLAGAQWAVLQVERATSVTSVRVPVLEGMELATLYFVPDSFDTDVTETAYVEGSLVIDEADHDYIEFQVIVPAHGVKNEVRVSVPFSSGELEKTVYTVIGDKDA